MSGYDIPTWLRAIQSSMYYYLADVSILKLQKRLYYTSGRAASYHIQLVPYWSLDDFLTIANNE